MVGDEDVTEKQTNGHVSRTPAPSPRFQMVVWELTLKCNLACGHCGSRAGKSRVGELTTDEALEVVRQLGQQKVREVALIGGEAYLRPDWDVIARAITEQGVYCSLVTGGRGFDGPLARRAKAAGVVNVSVSIDGLKPTHDLQRGVQGSFDAAFGAMRHLRQAGVPVSVNTQINRLSIAELEPLLECLLREGIRAWGVQLTVAMGRAADHPDWLIQPYELLDLFPRLARLKQHCDEARVRFTPGNNIGYFGPYESLLRGDDTPGAHWDGCQAGEYTLGIESDGTLKGCPSLPSASYAGGNLRDRPLSQLLHTAPLRVIQDRDRGDLWGFCRDCYYAQVCRAGCTWTSHVLFGRTGNNPYCHYRALQLERDGKRERLALVEPAPGVPFDHGRFQLILESLPPVSDEVSYAAERE